MRGKSVTRYGIILIAAFAALSAYAQQQKAPQQPEDFSTAFSKAHAACMALWADAAFDPIRDKFPFDGDKPPTFAMLTDPTRIRVKDKPLAALAIKTIEKCRVLEAAAFALLPQQTQQTVLGFYREQDSLNARLYLGKITIGEYNVALNRIVAEGKKALFGEVRPDPDSSTKQASAEVGGTKLLPVQPQAQAAIIQQSHQTRLALVIGNSKYKDLPKLRNPANDAGAIVNVLRGLGFDVTLVTDASELDIRRAVRKFADQSDQEGALSQQVWHQRTLLT
jgi:Caspase domain